MRGEGWGAIDFVWKVTEVIHKSARLSLDPRRKGGECSSWVQGWHGCGCNAGNYPMIGHLFLV